MELWRDALLKYGRVYPHGVAYLKTLSASASIVVVFMAFVHKFKMFEGHFVRMVERFTYFDCVFGSRHVTFLRAVHNVERLAHLPSVQ